MSLEEIIKEIIDYSFLIFLLIGIVGFCILAILFFIKSSYRLFIDFKIEREAYKKRRRKT